MTSILAVSLLCLVPTGSASTHEAAAVRAEVVRYLDDGYFLAELSLEEPRDATFLAATGVPCVVREGPVADVYLLPFGEGAVLGTVTRGSEPSHTEQLQSVQEEYSLASQEAARLRNEVTGFQTVLADADLPETARAAIARKQEAAQAELTEVEEQSRQLQAQLQELYAVHYGNVQTRRPWQPLLVGRVHGSGAAEVALQRPGSASRIELSVSSDVTEVSEAPSFVQAWAVAHLADVEGHHHEAGFSEFLSAAYTRRYEFGPPETPEMFRRFGIDVSLYDLFTGGAAIRESMQLDRVVESTLMAPRTVPITEVRAISLEDHPFEQMRGGREFQGSGLARLCPQDALYLRIKSLQEWFRIEDLFDRWGGSFLSTVHVSGADHGTMERYRRELALGNEALARLLGTKVIGEFALLAEDPLFVEGTALAVVFAPKEGQEAALSAMFAGQRRLAAVGDEVQRRETELDGITVDWVGDAAGAVNSYHCVLDGAQVFCNSLDLLRRMVATSRGSAPSLYDAADYQYYRALYPRDEEESGFLFLSQDWFRKITGPGWRIAHGRRMAAAEMLRDVHYAWQSAAPANGPPDLDHLLEGRWLNTAATEALDVTLDAATGHVACADYGSLQHLRPVDSLRPDRVSQREAELYEAFRQDYRRYWRQFIDPVGVQLRVGEHGLDVDTLILPLIENSVYGFLRMLSGAPEVVDSAAVPLPSSALSAVTLRCDPGVAGLAEVLREVADHRSGALNLDPSWLGQNVTLGVADGAMMFTGAAGGLEGWIGLRSGLDPSISLVATAILSGLTLPTFAAVEVRDPARVEGFLHSVWQQAAALQSDWSDVRIQTYTTPGEPRIHTVTFTFFVVDLRLHYAFVDSWLLLSNQVTLLDQWVEELQTGQGTPFRANGRLIVRPPAFQQAATAVGVAWQERIAGACRGNFAPLQRAADRGWFERADEFLGYRTLCPEGGSYALQDHEVCCTVHGTVQIPTQPLAPPDSTPAVRLVNELSELAVEFTFTGDGLRSQLKARFTPDK